MKSVQLSSASEARILKRQFGREKALWKLHSEVYLEGKCQRKPKTRFLGSNDHSESLGTLTLFTIHIGQYGCYIKIRLHFLIRKTTCDGDNFESLGITVFGL